MCVRMRVCVRVTGSGQRSPPTLFSPFFCAHPIRRRAALVSRCQPPSPLSLRLLLHLPADDDHNNNKLPPQLWQLPFISFLFSFISHKVRQELRAADFPESRQGFQSHLTL